MSRNSASTTVEVITRESLFATAASWSNNYDFSVFYEWTEQQTTGARERGNKHDRDCHEKTADLQKLVADAMHAHCASAKQAYARIEGYENLLWNVAVEMRRKDRTISDLQAKLDGIAGENQGKWNKREEEYRLKIQHFESTIEKYKAEVTSWKTVATQGDDKYNELRADVERLLKAYPHRKQTATTTTTTGTTSSVSGSRETTSSTAMEASSFSSS